MPSIARKARPSCRRNTRSALRSLPDDPAHPDPDKFYGFVFQDTDFSKWIEAVGYSLTHHPDADLEATADAAIDIVCAAQLDTATWTPTTSSTAWTGTSPT